TRIGPAHQLVEARCVVAIGEVAGDRVAELGLRRHLRPQRTGRGHRLRELLDERVLADIAPTLWRRSFDVTRRAALSLSLSPHRDLLPRPVTLDARASHPVSIARQRAAQAGTNLAISFSYVVDSTVAGRNLRRCAA